jgi:predicted transcriptional regulator
MADILRTLAEPRLKTPMMCSANLTHGQSEYYLTAMLSAGLIRNTSDDKWVSTEKGKRFVQVHEEVEMMLNNCILAPLVSQ